VFLVPYCASLRMALARTGVLAKPVIRLLAIVPVPQTWIIKVELLKIR